MRTGAVIRKRSGFTLIEMVISASVMMIILVAAYLCLRSGLLSQRLVDSRSTVVQNARVALSIMTADLRAARPLSSQFAFIGMRRTLEDTDADNLDFATHHFTPRRAGEADWCEVSYFVARSEGVEGFSLWRRRDSTPDDDPFSGGSREEIARGLKGLRIEYYDGFEWFNDWGDPTGRKAESSLRERPNLRGMPEAVRITLTLAPEKRGSSAGSSSTTEPPLVFEAICRLNLAGVSASPGLTGSATDPRNSDNAPVEGVTPGGAP